jgi:pyrroloquinoline quinone biosynthesis protein B
MRVRVLGAAAGGAFPQWNCSCGNCRRLREGRFSGSARSQTQLALSSDDCNWFLINASPDLRYQIENFSPLHPRSSNLRDSPISGIVIPSAEVDAALGLLLLRESQPLTVYATAAVRHILDSDNSIFGVLRRQPDQVTWVALRPDRPFELGESGILCIPAASDGGFPGFVSAERAGQLDESEAVLGFFFEQRGKRVAFFPGAVRVREEWLERMKECDAVFFDGTFWSDDELIRLQGGGKTARQMGHQPVEETLAALDKIQCRKIFIHINNTNPMLDEESEEFRRVREAGWEVSFDGMELVV